MRTNEDRITEALLVKALGTLIASQTNEGGMIFNSLSILIFEYLKQMPIETANEYIRLFKISLDKQMQILNGTLGEIKN